MMSSNQIAGMISQQNAMFGGVASYAQQITPPMGAAPGMGMGIPGVAQHPMFNQGPPPMGPPMPVTSSWSPMMMGGMGAMVSPPGVGGQGALAESFLSTGLSGAHTMTQNLGTMSAFAGIGATGLQMAGLGGLGATKALAAFGSPLITGGLGAMDFAAKNIYGGFQESQQVNSVLRKNFGTTMGIGEGRMGFNANEMGGITSMIREMGTEDLTASTKEITRVLDRTAGMGLFRGVQSARELKQKFQDTVSSLKEIAEIMHTTLEGATQFMGQQRGMGFFTGEDISKQLALTRTTSSVTGLSVGQVNQMAQQGAQLARATGGRGRSGAQAGVLSAGKFAMAQRMGILSDEDVAFATGGLTGAEGAQAMSGQLMQSSMRFMKRGAGRVMVAGLWDRESGGINQERLNQVMSGELGIRDLRKIARENISATGGNRSAFLRDEEQLRSKVLAQGGEYLPMAIYGTHLAEKRGLEMDDPIVQRMLRRKFNASQGMVEGAIKMMKNMPNIQGEMVASGRLVQEQEAQGDKFKGLKGIGKRLGRVWEREVEGPFRKMGADLNTDVSNWLEGLSKDLEGRVTARLGEAGKSLIEEQSEFGKAVSSSAKRLERFSDTSYDNFMKNARSQKYDARLAQRKGMGEMLGLRPGTGAGQAMYEGAYRSSGDWAAGLAKKALGLNEDISGIAPWLGTRASRAERFLGVGTAADLTKGADVALGFRQLAKDIGFESTFDEARDYNRASMTRKERAKALGFAGETDDEMRQFLSAAEGQMQKSIGVSAEEEKEIAKDYRDMMYSAFQTSRQRDAWMKTYVTGRKTGMLGVENSLARIMRSGSPKLKEAAKKASKGTKAEKVGFLRTMEETGDLNKEYRVTDEMSKEMMPEIGDLEDIHKIRSIRQKAMEDLGAAFAPEEDRRAKHDRKVKGDRLFNIFRYGGVALTLGIGELIPGWGRGKGKSLAHGVAQDVKAWWMSGGEAKDYSSVEDFMENSEAREAFMAWDSAGSKEAKAEALAKLKVARRNMDDDTKSTLDKFVDIRKAGSPDQKKTLDTIMSGDMVEKILANVTIQTELGNKLTTAMEGVSSANFSEEGQDAWTRLSEVARLRSSGDRENIKRSYDLEAELMDDIVGTKAGKELTGVLGSRKGGEFIYQGLTAGAGAYRGIRGKGKRGYDQRKRFGNVLDMVLGASGLDSEDPGILKAFGKDGKKGSQRDIINALTKGGSDSQEAIKKILAAAQPGMEEEAFELLSKRLGKLGGHAEDAKLTDEEARDWAGDVGGREAGRSRAKSRADKTATEDGQMQANKHLKTIEKAVSLMALRTVEESNPNTKELVDGLHKAITKAVTTPRPE